MVPISRMEEVEQGADVCQHTFYQDDSIDSEIHSCITQPAAALQAFKHLLKHRLACLYIYHCYKSLHCCSCPQLELCWLLTTEKKDGDTKVVKLQMQRDPRLDLCLDFVSVCLCKGLATLSSWL